MYSLRKHEILRKKQLIAVLFSGGKSVKGHFLRLVYTSLKPEEHSHGTLPLVLFTVSKKNISSAVRRNRVKRMMREAYRLEKPSLFIDKGTMAGEKLCIAFIYISRMKSFPTLEAFRQEIRYVMGSMVLS
jgi:ribonuclease P protein component